MYYISFSKRGQMFICAIVQEGRPYTWHANPAFLNAPLFSSNISLRVLPTTTTITLLESTRQMTWEDQSLRRLGGR